MTCDISMCEAFTWAFAVEAVLPPCAMKSFALFQVLPQDIREPLVQHENRASLLEVCPFNTKHIHASLLVTTETETQLQSICRWSWILEGDQRRGFWESEAANTCGKQRSVCFPSYLS